MSVASKCRSCGATIFWGRTESGRAIPLNPPRDGGNLAVRQDENGDLHCRAGIAVEGELPTTSHFQDCPNAVEHRKKR